MKLIAVIGLSILTSIGVMAQSRIDIQGHRGCRGLMPENTIPAMNKAMDLGVKTLEMDVHITKDNQVIVTHDPYLNPAITLLPDGSEISVTDAKKYPVYQMNYAELKSVDVGTKLNPKFPEQQKFKVGIPLLSELINEVEKYSTLKNHPKPFYNIEIKMSPSGDKKLHPEPTKFAELVLNLIFKSGIADRVTIQSFDLRAIEAVQATYPSIKTAFLIENKAGLNANLQKLSFKPAVYSPYYKLVTKEIVKSCHKQNIQIIPWTVNTKEEIEILLSLGVDGIITDYPDLIN